MKKEHKMLIGALAVLLVTIPLIVGVMATEDESDPSGNNIRQWFAMRLQLMKRRFYAIVWFFKGAENTVVTGAVTSRSDNILIVTSANGDRFNIVLPRCWNIDQQIVPLSGIDQYLSGEVTVKVLSRITTNENGVTVTILIAHEIASNGIALYAVLPYNIKG